MAANPEQLVIIAVDASKQAENALKCKSIKITSNFALCNTYHITNCFELLSELFT